MLRLVLIFLGISMGFIAPLTDSGAAAHPPQKKASVRIVFTGVRERRGYLNIALYNRAEGWLEDEVKSVAHRSVAVTEVADIRTIEVTFDDLEPGTYAVAAYHDANGNGKLDTNFLGIPKEINGTSNNPRPRFRAPRFDEAKFPLSVNEAKAITVHLHR